MKNGEEIKKTSTQGDLNTYFRQPLSVDYPLPALSYLLSLMG